MVAGMLQSMLAARIRFFLREVSMAWTLTRVVLFAFGFATGMFIASPRGASHTPSPVLDESAGTAFRPTHAVLNCSGATAAFRDRHSLFRGFSDPAFMSVSVALSVQVSRDARFEILRTVIADQAEAKIAMPFGPDGIELSDQAQINRQKLEKDMKKNGQSIEAGKVVTVTGISFDDNRIEIELDGGGKKKKGILDRLEVGIGSQTTPVSRDDPKQAKGSKVVLRFSGKVPSDLTPGELKELLTPVLDFNKRNFLKTGIDALPPEFQKAVKAREVMIGMDRSTVIMALGRPDKKVRAKTEGIETEDWIYFQRGLRTQFVTFENGVVVKIRQY